jgi:phage gp29-like protein
MERVKQDKAEMDARAIANTIQDQFVKVWYGLNFPARPDELCPELIMEEEEREDLEALGKYVWEAVDRGMKIPAAWLRDKIGAPEPEEGEEVLQPKAKSAPFGGAEQPDGAEPDGGELEDDGQAEATGAA